MPVSLPDVDLLAHIPDEVDTKYGAHVGVCKWFSDRLGYGFITICEGERKGADVFVHYKSIMPSNNTHRLLCKGEYVSFNTNNNKSGLQAADVTGVYGGSLLCDHMPARHGHHGRHPGLHAHAASQCHDHRSKARPGHGGRRWMLADTTSGQNSERGSERGSDLGA